MTKLDREEKECPKCGKVKNIAEDFGYRKMSIYQPPYEQSYCKACRAPEKSEVVTKELSDDEIKKMYRRKYPNDKQRRGVSQMKKRLKLIALTIALFVSIPVESKELESTINKAAHMQALVHTDRAKREKKWLCLKPGKIDRWYYEWVREDGSVAVKVEDHKLADVYDSRPFRESNPNLAIALPALQAVMNTTVNTVTAVK